MSRKKTVIPRKILRNKLDFILTDLLPQEISEAFSFYGFYKYLSDNYKTIEGQVNKTKQDVSCNTQLPFSQKWSTTPLRYKILKNSGLKREMSVISPLSIINAYLFIECYEDIVLAYLSKGVRTSLRHHARNSCLYYKENSANIIKYYENIRSLVGRRFIQQTGSYFKIRPYNSAADFTQSKKWLLLNNTYKNFAKTDIQRCFDSIYSHVYSWIVNRDVVDSLNSNNSNIYVVVDRIIQNLNGHLSHGLLVGPEFSRMLAELLLQHVDTQLINKLVDRGYVFGTDYEFYRYVDDYFIFANTSELSKQIVSLLGEVADEHRLIINDSKTSYHYTPYSYDGWMTNIRQVTDLISKLFENKNDCKYCKIDKDTIRRAIDIVYVSIKNYDDKTHTIISYILGTIINQLSRRDISNVMFDASDAASPLRLIRFVLFLVQFAPQFSIIQRAIVIIERLVNEMENKMRCEYRFELQRIIYDNESLFIKSTVNDCVNILLALSDLGVHISSNAEIKLLNDALSENNPIALAVLLLYSKYSSSLYDLILSKITDAIKLAMDQLRVESAFEDSAFWFILIFINCPMINSKIIGEIDKFVADLLVYYAKAQSKEPNAIFAVVICKYLQTHNLDLFFDWRFMTRSAARQISYRTTNRTVFRGYARKYSFSY